MPVHVDNPEAGSVLGVGIDIEETARIAEMLERWGPRFTERVYLPEERAYCDSRSSPVPHYTARFALKEAVSKAFGTGIGWRIGWLDIEVLRDDAGAPSVRLHGGARELADDRGVSRVLVSLSHTRHYAAAQALLLG